MFWDQHFKIGSCWQSWTCSSFKLFLKFYILQESLDIETYYNIFAILLYRGTYNLKSDPFSFKPLGAQEILSIVIVCCTLILYESGIYDALLLLLLNTQYLLQCDQYTDKKYYLIKKSLNTHIFD